MRVPQLDSLERARDKLRSGVFAANTLAGYRSDWELFGAWCKTIGAVHLPADPQTVSLYLMDLLQEGKRVTTARRHAAAISHYHRENGLPSPVSTETWRLLTAANRLRGERPRQAKPMTIEQLRAICGHLAREPTAEAVRNRAVITVGFCGALRRSNLVWLEMEDLDFRPEGVMVYIRREKQDRTGKGRRVALPYSNPLTCPVRALEKWLEIRGRDPGPVFTSLHGGRGRAMSDEAVTKIVRRLLARAGYDATGYGSHSLRAGFITAAGLAGLGELQIAMQTGHRSTAQLKRYFRPEDLFGANPCLVMGL